MRLAITQSTNYHADRYCVDSRSAKRLLKEQSVSLMALDFNLAGRENGLDLLAWAGKHGLLPNYIILTERDRAKRRELAKQLFSCGFKTMDEMNFIRT